MKLHTRNQIKTTKFIFKELTSGLPFGSTLGSRHQKTDQYAVLESQSAQKNTQQVIIDGIQAGANTVESNTFGLRSELHQKSPDQQKFNEATTIQFQLAKEIAKKYPHLVDLIIHKIPPATEDCYHSETGPNSIKDATDFHRRQLVPVEKFEGNFDIIFETLRTFEDLVGAINASKFINKPPRISITLDAGGMITQKDGSKLSYIDLIKKVDKQTTAYAHSFGINCSSLESVDIVIRQLDQNPYIRRRISSIVPNASSLPHDQLNNLAKNTGLIAGIQDSEQNGRYMAGLHKFLGGNDKDIIVGPCCGGQCKNIKHIREAISNKTEILILPETDLSVLNRERK